MIRKIFSVVVLVSLIGVFSVNAGEMGSTSVTLDPTLDKLGQVLTWNLDPSTCLGTPVNVGDMTIIPVVSKGFGFGLGGGSLFQAEGGSKERSSHEQNKDRKGMGLGGGGVVRTVAIIVLKKDGTFQLHRLQESFLAQVFKSITPMVQNIMEKVFQMKKLKMEQKSQTQTPASPTQPPQ